MHWRVVVSPESFLNTPKRGAWRKPTPFPFHIIDGGSWKSCRSSILLGDSRSGGYTLAAFVIGRHGSIVLALLRLVLVLHLLAWDMG